MGTKTAAKVRNKKMNKKKTKVSKFQGKKKSKIAQREEKIEPEKVDPSVESNVSSNDSSDCEAYEKNPRLFNTVNVRNLLPVKNKKGLVYRTEIIKNEKVSVPILTDEVQSQPEESTFVQYYATQRIVLDELKRKIALLCTSIVEDPESNVNALKDVVAMLHNPVTNMIISEKRLLCFSLLHVFSDILPGYRIRVEDNDKRAPLKKGTRKLLAYEKKLLQNYKKYIDYLSDLIKKVKWKKFRPSTSEAKKRAVREVGMVAVKCMCELLCTKFSFNYFKTIASKLIPLVTVKDEELTNLCCQSFMKTFKADTLGEASKELVIQIVSSIKEKNFCIPATLLKCFSSLNLREAKLEVEKLDMGKVRKEWNKMSRSQKKHKKKIKDLEAELREAVAHESVENVRKFHTETLNKVFWVYFHILKDADKIHLIAPALEGFSKFAYLINLEFFDDLSAVICGLMESGKLSDVDKLHGVYTLFAILTGQAEALHIDPYKIYCHMYQGLLKLGLNSEVEHFILTLKCLEFNILRKRKKISLNRVLAFTKRVSIISLQTAFHGTLGFLHVLRNILLNVKGIDILLDSENSFGSGVYLPEVEDPEHCNAASTTLWELHVLRKHFNPVVQLYSLHLLHNCPAQGRFSVPDDLTKPSPEDTVNMFADAAVKNAFEFLESTEEPPRKKIKYDEMLSLPYEKNIDFDMTHKQLEHVDFSRFLSDN